MGETGDSPKVELPSLAAVGAFVDQMSIHFDPSIQGWKLANAVWSRMGVDIPTHPRVALGQAVFPDQEQARESAETASTVADLALASYGATELIYQAPKMFNAIKSLPSVAQMLAGEGKFFATGGAVALESAGAEGLSWAAAGASPGASKLVFAMTGGATGNVPNKGTTGYSQLVNKENRIRNEIAAGGNRGINGKVTSAEADFLGERFVGEGYRRTVGPKGETILVSKDGLRQYRAPTPKATQLSKTGVQANFQSRPLPEGKWENNVHLDVEN